MRFLLPLLFSLLLVGCSSHYGSAKIVSHPEGAQVINDGDGSILGVTSTTAWWKDSNPDRKWIILRIRKPGYYEKVSAFWLSMRHKSQQDAMANPQLVEVVLEKKGN